MQICPPIIDPVSVSDLAMAAQPGAAMDKASCQLLNEELKTLGLRRKQHDLEPPCDEGDHIYSTNLV
jgi:hypothetical protein